MDRVRHGGVTELFLVEDVRVWAVGESNLALYDRENDDAWLAAENPADLHDWR